MQKYDLIVIGSGPGGQKAAIQASKLGKSVAIIEAKSAPGGHCTHTGTIPSKTFKRESDLFQSLSKRLNNPTANHAFLDTTLLEVERVVKREEAVAHDQIQRNRIDFFHGRASFVSPREVKVGRDDAKEHHLTAPNTIIATGSRPRPPKELKLAPPVFNSDTILGIEKLPKSMLVEGGGVIGSEYACIFHSLGVEVTLVNHHPDILHFLDKDLQQCLHRSMSKRGINMLMNCQIQKYQSTPDQVKFSFADGNSVVAETALICSGRMANIENLGLENLNIELEWGSIKVDKNYQTTEPGIYAVGDVIGRPCLAAAAMVHGRQAAKHCFGLGDDYAEPLIPVGIYTVPEVSYVGMTEEELIEKKLKYASGSASFSELARAQIDGTPEGFLKILFNPDDHKLYGVHIFGRGACELIHFGQTVMNLDGTLDYFSEHPANFPTYSGAYKVAAINGLNSLA